MGLIDVLQTIPCAVTPVMQFPVTFPPELAVVVPIPVIVVVLTVATTADVVKEISFPYTVPAPFVAYALT